MSKALIAPRAPAMRSAALLLAPMLVLAMALMPPTAGAAPPEAETAAWLQKLVNADRTLNYEGEMVYLQDGHMSSVAVIHHSGPNGVQERLTALDGTPREVVRGLKRLSCKLGADQTIDLPLQPAGDAATLAAHLDQLNDYYRISLGGRLRIAMRDTQGINLIPHEDSRYGHRLWLDADTGLALKTQMLDSDGRVIEQTMFTQITYLDPPAINAVASAGATPAAPDAITAEPVKSTDTGDTPFELSNWHAAQLPSGFRLTTHRRVDNAASPTEQLVYSDGLASISVFIEQLRDGDSGFNGSSRRGTVTLYGRTTGGHQLTVIGEVPEHTARRVGDGLQQN